MNYPGTLAALAFCFLALSMPASSQTLRQFIGTISGVKPQSGEIEIRKEDAASMSIQVTADTLLLKSAPGERDLRNAKAITVADLVIGDRALVTLEPATTTARRIVVMSAADIAIRNEADRLDWIRRGIAGIVVARSGNQITLKLRSLQGEVRATVSVDEGTQFKRYPPDSVRFAEAKPSALAEVATGDLLRARGQKSPDGLRVAADEVVFGAFLTKAGTIGSVNREANEITVMELESGKPLVVKITADSQLKRMSGVARMMAAASPAGMPPGGGPPAAGPPTGGTGGPAGRAASPPDLVQMLEQLPLVKIGDLRTGETIVVSSTKGARSGQITAIMLLGSADALLEMVSMQAGGNRSGLNSTGMNNALGGLMSGIELPSIIP